MDFDSIISFLLILLFFIFPTLLKRFNKKKKTNVSSQPGKARKLSLFEKLGEQIRVYAETLEQEAQKGKKPRENMWDQLADDPESQTNEETEQEIEPVFASGLESGAEPSIFAATPGIPENKKKQSAPKCEKAGQKQGSPFASSLPGTFSQPKLSSCQLQQAIIWSEILSKPVALRQDMARV